MISNKVLLKIVYGLVGASIVAVIALTVYQQKQIKKMGRAESGTMSKLEPSPNLPESTAGTETTRRRADAGKEAAALDGSYGMLFKKLALSPARQDAFESLLLDLQTKTSDLNMEMLDTSISEEKRDEIQKRLEKIVEEDNQKIHIVLGTDDFQKYLAYEDRLDERTLLAAFFASLSPEETLTEPREQAFIDAMFEERMRVDAESRGNEEADADLEMQIARILETTDRTHAGYTKVAGDYLSPPLIEKFSNFLGQRHDMMAASLNVMRQVFESDPATDRPGKETGSAEN